MSLTEYETQLLSEMSWDYIESLLVNEPLVFSEQNFDSYVLESVYDIMYIQIGDLYNDDIEEELFKIIEESFDTFFACEYPPRSHSDTYIVRTPRIETIDKQIEYLTKIPQQDQRTEEWFKIRHNYLTASNVWKAFSTDGTRNQLIYSKCIPYDTTKYDGFNLESPLHWGQKYEKVSLEWYETKYTTKVSEFGCIPHPSVKFLAASPDGINTDKSSCRYGRMVEVKNIVNRDITGIPKSEYWIQMQIQMEVCNLDECDFIETRFIEYPDNESFMGDGSFTTGIDGNQKGIMLLFLDINRRPVYEYARIGIDEDSFYEWNDVIMEKNKEFSWLKTIYWKLGEVSVVLVDRNRTWFEAALVVMSELWETIELERVSGCNHRAPNKRQRIVYEADITVAKCLIDALTI